MKCTIIANYGAGPFLSGKNQMTVQEAAENLMLQVSDDFMEEASETIAFDRGLGDCKATADDFLDAMAGRIRFVLA
jgi:hypothetical protein